MNPLSVNPLALLVGVLAAIGIGFGSGWTANGWRLNAEISNINADRAVDSAKQAKAALDDLATAARAIHDAAEGAGVDVSSLGTKLDLIRKDFKNAKPAPLPVDCRPDAVRVRKLTDTTTATDQAIAGSKLGSSVQAERAP